MKYFIAFLLAFICVSASAQEIKFYYQDDNLTRQGPITIKEGTNQIEISNATNLRDFHLDVDHLPTNHIIKVYDFRNTLVGEWRNGQGLTVFRTASPINNSLLKFYHGDANGVQKEFAIVTVLEELPRANIDILTPTIGRLQQADQCEPCKYKNNIRKYDFSKNHLSYEDRDNRKFSWGRPVVGRSYTFLVTNINPFRDSVIISHETVNYNTDVPDLFTRAFFGAAMMGTNAVTDALTADVLELGNQLDNLVEILKNTPECDSICKIIQRAKTDIDRYFRNTYNIPANADISVEILRRLQGIPGVRRQAVIDALNKYRAVVNIKTYFTYQIPQVQNVDAYLFTLSIIAKSGFTSNSIVDNQLITANTVGGFKVDFSTGLFVTSLRDHRYLLRPDSSVIQNQFGGDSIVFNRRNQIVRLANDHDFGVSALMHFYPRLTPSVNLGISLGAGLSIGPDPSIRYLGGASLILGSKGRLILSYGWAAGFANVLADSYQEGQYVSLSNTSDIMKKRFKTKSFWALTFNIPIFKSKVDTSAKPAETKTETKSEEKSEEKK